MINGGLRINARPLSLIIIGQCKALALRNAAQLFLTGRFRAGAHDCPTIYIHINQCSCVCLHRNENTKGVSLRS